MTYGMRHLPCGQAVNCNLCSLYQTKKQINQKRLEPTAGEIHISHSWLQTNINPLSKPARVSFLQPVTEPHPNVPAHGWAFLPGRG